MVAVAAVVGDDGFFFSLSFVLIPDLPVDLSVELNVAAEFVLEGGEFVWCTPRLRLFVLECLTLLFLLRELDCCWR